MNRSDGHDLLLEWMSERGSGSWQHFRDAHAWIGSQAEREPWETASFTARQMSALGHVEVDWSASRWSAAPPVLTILPSAGAHALLTGGRTRALCDRLRKQLDGREDVYGLPAIEQAFSPSALLIASEDERAAQGLAEDLGVDFSHSVSSQLIKILPPLDSYLGLARSTPAPTGYGVQALDSTELTWLDVEDDVEPGLYRYQAPAGFSFRFLDDGGRAFAVDLAIGIYTELARSGECRRLKWFRGSLNGELEVPLRAPLPTLHARAATLCSGLSPQRRGRSLVYVNVPEKIAASIGRALGQSLNVIDLP
jgi:hypothetical protein